MADPLLSGSAAPGEEQAIDAVLANLRDDSGIVGAGIAIWADEGDRSKLPEVTAAPEYGQLPVIRLIDGTQPLSWSSEITHRGPLTIDFELFCGRGYKARRRIIKLLVNALFPQDLARLQVTKTRLGSSGVLAEKLSLGSDRRAYLGEQQDIQRIKAAYVLVFDDAT